MKEHTERPAQLVASGAAGGRHADARPSRGRWWQLVRDATMRISWCSTGRRKEREEIVTQAAELHSKGVRIRTLSLFYDAWLGKLPDLRARAHLAAVRHKRDPQADLRRSKRFLDLVIALLGPVRPRSGRARSWRSCDLFGNRGPLFYSQPRVGKDGVVFTIHKFRTMRPGTMLPRPGPPADDPRLGKVGRMLRRLHVDELPRCGTYSGAICRSSGRDRSSPTTSRPSPRPSPSTRFATSSARASPAGRRSTTTTESSDIDALEKLQYEFYYLRHQSLGLDLRIIGRTLRTVFEDQGR